MSKRRAVQPLRGLTQSSVVAMAGGIVSQALKFLVVVYVAREFSSVEFGWFSFALAVNAFVFVISHFGLPVYGSREVVRSGHVAQHLLAAVLWSRALLALLGTGVALAALGFVPGVTRQEYFLVAIFGLSNVSLAGLFDWAFQGLNRQEASAALNVAWQFLWLAFVVAGVRAGAGILVVPISLCLAALIASFWGYVWLRKTDRLEKSDWRQPNLLRESWKLLNSGAALGTGTLLITVLVWTDTIAVRLLRGEQAAGVYAAGNRAALALATLAAFYVQGAFPLLSQSSSESPVRFQHLFHRAYSDLALLFVPGSLWAMFYAPEVIDLLFKRTEYLAGVPVFVAFQAALLFFVFNGLCGTGVLLASHRDQAYQKVLLATTALFLLLCPLLTIRWGIRGAALATLLSQVFSSVLFSIGSRGLVRPRHVHALLLPCLFGLGAGIFGLLLHLSLFPALVTLLLAYACLLGFRFWAMRGSKGWGVVGLE
jgi:O-antigen/teichoic acid export membrane protein